MCADLYVLPHFRIFEKEGKYLSSPLGLQSSARQRVLAHACGGWRGGRAQKYPKQDSGAIDSQKSNGKKNSGSYFETRSIVARKLRNGLGIEHNITIKKWFYFNFGIWVRLPKILRDAGSPLCSPVSLSLQQLCDRDEALVHGAASPLCSSVSLSLQQLRDRVEALVHVAGGGSGGLTD